ncbi:MAG: UDP-3-O-(3-hydroxymyristoyl)glucosamine N-acyltransferase [Gammaproteobacteria bacterium]
MVGITLGELAEQIGATLHGDPERKVQGIATLQHAEPGSISFLANPHYRKFLATTSATAVILGPEDREACPVITLVSNNPYLSYARAAEVLYPKEPPLFGIHPSAVVDGTAKIDDRSWIGPNSVIEAGVVVCAGAHIGPGCVVGAGSVIGKDSCLHANVSICESVILGVRVLIHPGVVIGSDGFGIANDDGSWVKVPQLGGVEIGDDVEIGANTTIDRGALENTVIEKGVKLDNQIQVAHNVKIGAYTAIAGCVGIAGSAKIGKRCMIGGAVGILGHLEITDDVQITAMSLVSRSIMDPGVYSSGVPLQENPIWRKNAARFKQLDDMAARINKLESGRGEEDD